ncbi:larval cuticle protein LCP-30-like [Musca domestica]|uniref:Larval cuticle protein LCP-30-like n=1 Tax=Musca domestica TaxID=7370 RepID=A0ABM3USA8_MUSDO|nr:larval cuticle protein LCP-30-like [Musca domestica]
MQLLLRPWLCLVLLALVSVAVRAQNDGRYKPPTRPPTRPTPKSDGRYRPANDGRYRPGGDGKYRGGNDGKYVHKDVKYVHDDRPGGGYTGDANPYKQDKDRFGPGGGGGGGAGNAAANGANAGGGAGAKKPSSGSGSGGGGGILAAAVTAKPLPKGKGSGEGKNGWAIIRLEDKVEEDGYHYLYETENGILAEENGRIEALQTDPGLRSKGFYEYTGDDGNLYRVEYTADDNGFVAQGDHLPVVPPHIPKLLAYLAANASNKK